jgi:hypothetical protein
MLYSSGSSYASSANLVGEGVGGRCIVASGPVASAFAGERDSVFVASCADGDADAAAAVVSAEDAETVCLNARRSRLQRMQNGRLHTMQK